MADVDYRVLGIALLICAALGAAWYVWRRGAPPISASVAVGAVVRAGILWITAGHPVFDTSVWFRQAADLVVARRDPLLLLGKGIWNFFPLPAYLLALSRLSPMPWAYAEKAFPVAADLVVIALIGRLADRRGRSMALVYAFCPAAILVSAYHGQLEPIALAFALGAVLLSRRRRPGWAGALLGLAVAAKSWPLVFAPGLLRDQRTNAARRKLATTAGVALGVVVISWPLVVTTDLRQALPVMASHGSLTGGWGWAGVVLIVFGPAIEASLGPDRELRHRRHLGGAGSRLVDHTSR